MQEQQEIVEIKDPMQEQQEIVEIKNPMQEQQEIVEIKNPIMAKLDQGTYYYLKQNRCIVSRGCQSKTIFRNAD